MFICDVMLMHYPKMVLGDWLIDYENKMLRRSDVLQCDCGNIAVTYYHEEDYSGLIQEQWDVMYEVFERRLEAYNLARIFPA